MSNKFATLLLIFVPCSSFATRVIMEQTPASANTIFVDTQTIQVVVGSSLPVAGAALSVNGAVNATSSMTASEFVGPLTGNVTASTISSDTGTFTDQVAAGSFSGPLSGNVTGNLTGNVTGNLSGSVTGNVTGNLTGQLLTSPQNTAMTWGQTSVFNDGLSAATATITGLGSFTNTSGYSLQTSSGINNQGNYFSNGTPGVSVTCGPGNIPVNPVITNGLFTKYDSCGVSGTGNAVLADTQTWTGENTFTSTVTISNLINIDITYNSVTTTTSNELNPTCPGTQHLISCQTFENTNTVYLARVGPQSGTSKTECDCYWTAANSAGLGCIAICGNVQ